MSKNWKSSKKGNNPPSMDMASLGRFIDRHFAKLGKLGVNPVKYKTEEVLRLLDSVRNVLGRESSLLEISAPVIIVGDIHGQFNDLTRCACTKLKTAIGSFP